MSTKEFRMCLPPFQEWYSSGPFYDKNNDRMLIHLLRKGSPARTLSYPRYLYSVKVGEEPSPDYEVDHIDGNRRNDSIDNLQLLSVGDNLSKSHRDPRKVARLRILEMTCPSCGNKFQKQRGDTHVGKKKGNRTYCSMQCSRAKAKNAVEDQTWVEVQQATAPTARYCEPWSTWSGTIVQASRLAVKETKRFCLECHNAFSPQYSSQRMCSNKCASLASGRRHARINKDTAEPEILKVLKGDSTWLASGKLLGVSDKGLKKWAEKNGYPVMTRSYNKS